MNFFVWYCWCSAWGKQKVMNFWLKLYEWAWGLSLGQQIKTKFKEVTLELIWFFMIFLILSLNSTNFHIFLDLFRDNYYLAIHNNSRIKKIHLELFPILRAFWFLKKNLLCQIRVSGTLLMIQQTQNSPHLRVHRLKSA